MKSKYWAVLSLVISLGLLTLWGCQGNKALAPVRPVSLTVSVAKNNDLQASLLGSSLNEILYVVRAPGMPLVTGTTGTFVSTAQTGTVDFNISMSSGPNWVLALQLNDATTNLPLAIGAVGLNIDAATAASGVTVELGSVVNYCYVVTTANYYGDAFNFDQDYLDGGLPCGYDSYYDEYIQQDYTYGGFQFVSPQVSVCDRPKAIGGPVAQPINSIAYMGNGNLVNDAYVPPTGNFFSTSSAAKIAYEQNSEGFAPTPTSVPVYSPAKVNTNGDAPKILAARKAEYDGLPFDPDFEVGDVYCIALASVPGGYAWVQITSTGNAGVSAPSFIFRESATQPFYGYYQSTSGLSGNCIIPGGGGLPCNDCGDSPARRKK